MIFSTSLFLLFFAVVFIIYWFVLGQIKDNDKKLKARIIFLLLASYYFYMSWNPIFILLILFSTVVDYFAGKKIHKSDSQKQKKFFLILSLVTNLGFLAYFKYTNFFLDTINSVSGLVSDTGTNFFLDIVLPVGISFYTFQSMCYTIDIYYGKMKPSKDFFEFALYVTFFPQLVAGPIVRAIDFIPQLKENRVFNKINFQLATNYFLLGLFKKVVIADNIAPYSDALFAAPEQYGTIATWVGVTAYSVQIYCDFSGYSDMAIGVAALLGFKLMENFNMPYGSTSITEFWRKWHISLSSWLRDYLFIPLGGSRVSKKIFYYRNLMLTMLLGGLWHGASWNFVVWGGLHGLALIVHKLYKTKYADNFNFSKPVKALYTGFSWLLTMVFVMITWVFFRAQTFGEAATVLKNMFIPKGDINYNIPLSFIILFVITFIGHLIGKKYFYRVEDDQKHLFKNPYVQGAIFGIVIFAVLLFGSDDNQAFIYFQF